MSGITIARNNPIARGSRGRLSKLVKLGKSILRRLFADGGLPDPPHGPPKT